MTWHLKDRELEKKLIAIDPEFIDKLQMTKGYGNYGFHLNLGGYVNSGDVGVPKIQIYLVREEIEEVPEYNPNARNEFPKVKPPYDVMMRIEFENGEGTKGFYKHCFDGSDCWFSKSRIAFPKTMLINNPVTRFRPWSED